MHRITSGDGTAIAFDRLGTGPAVILVGGAFQYRAFDPRTARLAELLAEEFTVVHYDRRGRGESTDTPPYTTSREVEDLEALIQATGGSACVFGMSSGGALALEAAAHGAHIDRLGVYEVPFNAGDQDSRRAAEEYRQGLARILAEERRGDAVALALSTWGAPPEAIAGMRQSPIWPLFEAVAPTLAYDAAVMGDGAVPAPRLASVKLPTLVMAGTASPALMTAAARAVAHALPHAEVLTLDGQSHEVAPEVLAPALLNFFRG